jgi:hypothetical protein
MPKKKLIILTDDLYVDLTRYAKEKNCSANQVIRNAIKKYINSSANAKMQRHIITREARLKGQKKISDLV